MIDYNEEDYPFLVNKIMFYVESVKATDRDISIIDIIMDYSVKYNISLETIGDAISGDTYFKSFIEKDCQLHKMFRVDCQQLDEW